MRRTQICVQRYKKFLTYTNKYTDLLENAANYSHISKIYCPLTKKFDDEDTILCESVNVWMKDDLLGRPSNILQFLPCRFGYLLNFTVGLPTIEHHADGVVLDGLTFARTEFDKVGSRELVG